MQTKLLSALQATDAGREADRILRTCVHCGFCTATCPTYQLLGDELDGPRGRIYQIKVLLEGEAPTRSVQTHLDRCLTCLNCMTTCPSGVQYDRLLATGRGLVEEQVPRPAAERLLRRVLRLVVPYPARFGVLLQLGRAMRPLLPAALKAKLPAAGRIGPLPAQRASRNRHPRRVIMLESCVEPALTPAAVGAAVRVLDALGIEVIRPGGGCCGAVSEHLSAHDEARAFMRRNIDAWWPYIAPEAARATGTAPVEAILSTASGCGAMVKDYGHHLADDPRYAHKAARVSALARDPCELLTADDLRRLPSPFARPGGEPLPRRIAFHPPCTLQHGQRLMGRVEALLRAAGFELVAVRDAHSCCGAAGTYSVLQPALAGQLRERKLDALHAGGPALIATANVGCQTHLAAAARVPVVHWLELFDPAPAVPICLGG
ncbi:MAG: glycolate oxidase subunit GlcF [Thiohalocapsa sp.]|uniref:glycolate oxidase subunit GlcF n=1 Tax=Thiohalocapsa sp. TaxID=2497641 RepID=UPI0025DFA2E1|nr:glycolate oxidase subunit GlcF [Thiohalocapsa sp.]MCG6939701.1 glycolate oxidase subunit GlcF [Thiohalocapsa sp.]